MATSSCHPFEKHIKPLTLIQQKVQWYPETENAVIIVSPASSLVLDASFPEVKLAEYTGSPLQKWQFECIENGVFLLKNVGAGEYLQEGSEDYVVILQRSGALSQQWQYSPEEQAIKNKGSGKVMDVTKGHYVPGTRIIMHPKHGGYNQKFVFQTSNP